MMVYGQFFYILIVYFDLHTFEQIILQMDFHKIILELNNMSFLVNTLKGYWIKPLEVLKKLQ